jgi:hypothetical protein
VWDDKAGYVAGPGCWIFQARYAQCAGGSPIVDLGGGDDSLHYNDDTTVAPIGPGEGPGGRRRRHDHHGDVRRRGVRRGRRRRARRLPGQDVLHGDEGDDRVDGSFDDDVLVGGAGTDTVLGGTGDDADRRARRLGGDVVRCHDGDDTVKADRGDDVGADCEIVDLPALPAPPEPPKDEPKEETREPRPGVLGSPSPGATTVSGLPLPASASGGAAEAVPLAVAGRDRSAPRLTILRRVRRAGRLTITVRCDEACTVVARSGRRRATRNLRAGGSARLALRGRTATLSARDAAGNTSRRVVR